MATRPIEDYAAYRESLTRFVYQTSMFMRPVFAAAKAAPQRVAYAEARTTACCAPPRWRSTTAWPSPS